MNTSASKLLQKPAAFCFTGGISGCMLTVMVPLLICPDVFEQFFDNGELDWKDEGSNYFVTVKSSSSSSSCVCLLSAEWHHCGPFLYICISPSVCCCCTNTAGLRCFTASIKQQSPQPDSRRLTPPPPPPPQRLCGAVRGREKHSFFICCEWWVWSVNRWQSLSATHQHLCSCKKGDRSTGGF